MTRLVIIRGEYSNSRRKRQHESAIFDNLSTILYNITMSRSVDRLTSKREQSDFAGRRHSVMAMAVQLGLNAANAVVIGGSAFAIHGLNTYVPRSEDFWEPFDLDGYVSHAKFVDLNVLESGSAALLGHKVVFEGRKYPLPAMFFTKRPKFDHGTSLPTDFEAAQASSELVDGLSVLPLSLLAPVKLAGRRVKDIAGVLKAHIIADSEQHPVASDPVWLEHVGVAADIARTGNMEPNRAKVWRGDVVVEMPRWLNDLVAIDFEHEAFRSVG